MGHKNREKEKKLLVKGTSNRREVMLKMKALLEGSTGINYTIEGDSKDVYWHPPVGAKATFLRVRYMAEGRTQVTLKHEDKGDYTDRVEIDLEADDPEQAIALMTNLIGPHAGTVRKKYTVFFLDKKDTTICEYKVHGDPDGRVFIEVEARELEKVEALVDLLRKGLPWELEVIDKSLYKLFVANKPTGNLI